MSREIQDKIIQRHVTIY